MLKRSHSAVAEPRMELSLTVLRADGTREDLGVVAKSHPSRWERLQARLRGTSLGQIYMGGR